MCQFSLYEDCKNRGVEIFAIPVLLHEANVEIETTNSHNNYQSVEHAKLQAGQISSIETCVVIKIIKIRDGLIAALEPRVIIR
jgi:hypothetical protein